MKLLSTKMAKLLLLVILVIMIVVNEVVARGGSSGSGQGGGTGSGHGRGGSRDRGGNRYGGAGHVPCCGTSNRTCGRRGAASKFGYSHYNLVFVIVCYFLVYAIL